MVLAKTENLNVLHDNKLIVIFMEDSAVNNVPEVLLIALGKVHHSFCITFGCTMKTLSFRVLSDTLEQSTDCSGELLLTSCGLFGGGFESLACASAYTRVRRENSNRGWLKHTGPAQTVEVNGRGECVGTASSAGLLRRPVVTRISGLGLFEVGEL